jgi:hypothetical protein
MAQELVRLVYFSRNAMVGGRDELAEQIGRILAVGRANNLRAHVTGALLFNSGVFADVMEGPRKSVAATFKRIERDPRHKDVQILSVEPVETRLFPHWSIGFLGRSREDQRLFGHLAEMTGLDQRQFEGERILKLIREIAIDEEATATA